MPSQSSPVPPLEELRALARLQGVEPAEDDLRAAAGFLATILPALEGIEAGLEPGVPPAGLFLPDANDG
jgi:hypothetical protein